MPYTPNPLDDTQPNGATVQAKEAAPEFRAIKTLLISHNTAINTTLPNAIAAESARLDDYDAKTFLHNRQWFAASGNFTVPAGVTEIYVTGAGGGIDGYAAYQDSHGGTNWTALVPRRDAVISTVKLTVTPLDVLPVVVGANGSLAASGGLYYTLNVAAAATASSFDTTTVFPARKPCASIYRASGYPSQYSVDDEAGAPAGYALLTPGSNFPASLGGSAHPAAAASSTNAANAPFVLVEW